jgi:hypothetical protein
LIDDYQAHSQKKVEIDATEQVLIFAEYIQVGASLCVYYYICAQNYCFFFIYAIFFVILHP